MNETRVGVRLLLSVLLASSAQAQPPEQHLAEAIRFATISHESKAEFDVAPFLALHAWLEATYPQAHRVLQREKIAAASLLYTWPGSDASLAPFLLTSHLDVVPVPDPESWTHPPFAGEIAEGFVWGRGTLDDKAGVVATFEALELLAGQGFRPRRTLLVAFGHDEEVGGEQGAGAITQRLLDAGVRAWFSLDEGMAIAEAGATTLTDTPLALIGVAEKGTHLEAHGPRSGRPLSTPPPSTAIGRFSRAIVRLEERPPVTHAGRGLRHAARAGAAHGWDPAFVLAPARSVRR
jgi:carboxypeptidase PM20D1